MDKEIKIPFNDKLNKEDTEDQTYGCRANNPNICANCYVPNICAFVRNDNICKKPTRAWKKQYETLKEEEKNGQKNCI